VAQIEKAGIVVRLIPAWTRSPGSAEFLEPFSQTAQVSPQEKENQLPRLGTAKLEWSDG